MSNEELEDDIVLAKFINYMQKALYHMRLNYFRDYVREICRFNKDQERQGSGPALSSGKNGENHPQVLSNPRI